MGRRRTRTSAIGGNLDSMLDTLTNVVGILVIMLVAVQLSSQEAASKIAATLQSIGPEDVARMEQAAAEARDQATAAAEALREQRLAVSDPQAELSRLETALRIEDDLARQAAARAAELQNRHAAELKAAAEAERRAAEARATRAAETKPLEARVAALRRELQSLPVPTPPPAKQVRLPDPRPAPAGVRELQVLCREGRLWVVDVASLQEKAKKRADFVVRSKKLDPDGDSWLADGETFVEVFNEAPVREAGFTMSVAVVNNRWPQLVLERGRGETAEDAIKNTGELSRMLRRIAPETHVVRFFVWPDSFDGYLRAREFTAERGFAAGWEPVGSPAEHRIPLGKYAIGRKPPPAPPPSPGTKPPPPPNLID